MAQEWTSVEGDDESEDSQVCWEVPSSFENAPPCDLSGPSLSFLRISLRHGSLGNVSPREVSRGKSDIFLW